MIKLHVTGGESFAWYQNKAKNEVKTDNLVLSSALANIVGFGKLATLLFDRNHDYNFDHW